MVGHTISCDMCERMLVGKARGGEYVSDEHLVFRGLFWSVYPGESDRYYISRNGSDDHHFCTFKCLMNYAQFRKNKYESIKRDGA